MQPIRENEILLNAQTSPSPEKTQPIPSISASSAFQDQVSRCREEAHDGGDEDMVDHAGHAPLGKEAKGETRLVTSDKKWMRTAATQSNKRELFSEGAAMARFHSEKAKVSQPLIRATCFA